MEVAESELDDDILFPPEADDDGGHHILEPFASSPESADGSFAALEEELNSAHHAELPTSDEPFFPTSDSIPPMSEMPPPSREQSSDLLHLSVIVSRLEASGFGFPGLARLPSAMLGDLEQVLLQGQWIQDEQRMRIVMIQVLSLDGREPARKALEREPTPALTQRFIAWLSDRSRPNGSLPTRLITSRDSVENATNG